MSLHLTRDLEQLHHDLLTMSSMVEEMIHLSVDTLSEPSYEKAQELAAKDDIIDRWDVRLEESCLKVLALHQPVAIDLRRLTTVLKITAELERVADLGVHIAERACSLINGPAIEVPDRLQVMVRAAVDMLHRSINAYVQLDSNMARQVCDDDDRIDHLNRSIIEELRDQMERTPSCIESALHLFSASRHVERVADHATNIAEDVVYLVEGEIIRHRTHLKDEAPH
ncbi:MAG: phosphate signaling complex protein PhoU [Planctomycetaceae bacterium]|nr:phosphate signaling complex protein PhoU [Planctomycetaceae bacterium]